MIHGSQRREYNMKRYKVTVYNKVDKIWDEYEVNAIDPVDARNVTVQRLIDETGHGLDVYELTDVREVKE
jgi:hypothetical protein